LHSERVIFAKAAKILHKLILSLISVYATELSGFAEHEDQNPFTLLHTIHRHSRHKFQPRWHTVTPQERQYALLWVKRLWVPIRERFTGVYFSSDTFCKQPLPNDINALVNMLMLNSGADNNIAHEQKQEIYRSL
jgi:hypothetical protein